MSYLEYFNQKKQAIEDLLDNVTALLKTDKVQNDPNIENEFNERFKVIDSSIRKQLNQSIPYLVPQKCLNVLQEALQQIKNHLDNNISLQFKIINSTLDTCVTILSQIPTALKKDIKTSLNTIITNHKDQFEQTTNDLNDQTKEFSNSLMSSQKKLDEINNKLSDKEKEVVNITTNFQKQFSDTQEKRRTEFDTIIKQIDASHEKKTTEISEKTNEIINRMEADKDKSKELLGIVGKNAYAGSYTTYANKAKNFANLLFWCSIGFMIIFAGCIIVPTLWQAFTTSGPDKLNLVIILKEMLYRLPVFAVLLLPAFYMANESRKQREKEFRYRDFEIKVAASEPYISNISDDVIVGKDQHSVSSKDQLRIDLAKSFFGQLYNEDRDSNVVIPKDVLALFEKLLDKVIKIQNK